MTLPLSVEHLSRSYGDFRAVDDLSFEVHQGEIFGLLGPNGAGKTTTIRIIMSILEADGGTVTVLGEPPGVARARVGYLPEERGLYPDQKLMNVLIYLGQLKGTDAKVARARAERWLDRVGLADRADEKVKSLSRGMQQKVQIVASLVHDPDLLIFDEPFAGLDPVNVDLVEDIIHELQAEGKTILLSAHQMNLVEALCNRIVLINKGHAVLYGDLETIKETHSPGVLRVRTPSELPALPGVAEIMPPDNGAASYRLMLEDGVSAQDVLASLISQNIPIRRFEVASAPLEEIFVKVVTEGNDE